MKNSAHIAICYIIVLVLSATSGAIGKDLFWWSSEYQNLIGFAAKQKGNTATCSYRAGDDAHSVIKISIVVEKTGTILMKLEGAGENIVDADENAGTYEQRSGRAAFYFRDINKDGMPDEVKDESNPDPADRLRYYQLSEYEDPEGLLVLWNIGIGYSINKLLHGIDSALPRKKR